MKTKLHNFFKTKYFHISVCVILTILASLVLLPYLQADRHSGHDLKYHFTVIRALLSAWNEGNFGGKVMELIGGDYGYGTGIFYSTFPASLCVILIKLFHLSQTAALYVEMLLLFGSASIVVYFFLFRVFKNIWIAALGGISYLFYPYFLWDLYVRFAFTEIFLMLALPLIVWGVYELLYNNHHVAFYILFILGYTLAVFSHFTMTVYITLFVGIWLAIEWKKTFHKKNVLALGIATVIVLLITASYYLPMLVNYGITDTSSMSKTAEQIKTNTLKYYTETILTLDFLYIACAYLLYVLYYVFCAHKKRTAGRTALFILSTLILLIYNPYFPWKYMPNFLRMIQYTFRILLFAGITTPIAVGIMLQDAFFRKSQKIDSLKQTAGKTKIIRFDKALLLKIVKISCQIILIFGLLCCSWFGYQHNVEMPKSLYNNASSTTYGDNAVSPLTGHSEFYGLGAGKHGDYFPTNCTRNYVSTRIKNQFIYKTNMQVSELAVYNSLSQVSFLVQKTTDGYAVLNIPYSVFEGAEVYRFKTNAKNEPIEITAAKNSSDDKVRIDTADYNGESKIIIFYKNAPAFENYLKKIALGVLPLKGDVVAQNLEKDHAGKYSLEVHIGKGGILELPSYYYKGYQITLVDENGKKRELQPIHGRNGFIEVEIHRSGKLYVEFTSNYLTLSYCLSALGVVAFVGIIVYCIHSKKKSVISCSPSQTPPISD